jgi:hypothetical protein
MSGLITCRWVLVTYHRLDYLPMGFSHPSRILGSPGLSGYESLPLFHCSCMPRLIFLERPTALAIKIECRNCKSSYPKLGSTDQVDLLSFETGLKVTKVTCLQNPHILDTETHFRSIQAATATWYIDFYQACAAYLVKSSYRQARVVSMTCGIYRTCVITRRS